MIINYSTCAFESVSRFKYITAITNGNLFSSCWIGAKHKANEIDKKELKNSISNNTYAGLQTFITVTFLRKFRTMA